MQAIGQRKVFVLEERSKKPLCFVTSNFCSQKSAEPVGSTYLVQSGTWVSARECQSFQARATHRALVA